MVKSEIECLVRVKDQRDKKIAQLKPSHIQQEIFTLQEDLYELEECKKVLRNELLGETECVDELTTIIQQLKRNFHEEKRDKEKAVQTHATSCKILKNTMQTRETALENKKKFLHEHRNALDRGLMSESVTYGFK
jgi:hypothetical protein